MDKKITIDEQGQFTLDFPEKSATIIPTSIEINPKDSLLIEEKANFSIVYNLGDNVSYVLSDSSKKGNAGKYVLENYSLPITADIGIFSRCIDGNLHFYKE